MNTGIGTASSSTRIPTSTTTNTTIPTSHRPLNGRQGKSVGREFRLVVQPPFRIMLELLVLPSCLQPAASFDDAIQHRQTMLYSNDETVGCQDEKKHPCSAW